MAEQVLVTVDDIARRENGGRLVLRVAIYAENADPNTEAPLFEGTAEADIKAHIEGLSRQQLVNRATSKAGEELLGKVQAWRRIEEYKSMVNTDAVANAIVDELSE